ncbi:MAG: hypothetical protein GYB58_14765 [Gammaproteobacteria bacterium]|nr:hypothetical protein [Gammaproteobacteria bacterium]
MDNSRVDITKPVFALYASLSGRNYPTLYGPDKRALKAESFAVNALYPDGINKSDNKDKVHHVVRFLCFLHQLQVQLSKVRDSHIETYRNSLLTEGTINQKRTINIYLTTIYKFIANYYETDPIRLSSLIGPTHAYQVNSGIFDENRARVSKKPKVKLYPLKYTIPSAKGLTSLRLDQIPTDTDYILLLDCIVNSGSDPFIIQRDKLAVEIARSSAFRRNSIISLKASQFRDITDAEDTGKMSITPAKQKYGYKFSFEINYSLALKINLFINDSLDPYLKENRLSLKWSGALFINQDGTDMKKQYLTIRISSYAKKLGWPKRKVLHVFRHLFAIEESESEYESQLKVNSDPNVAKSATRIHLKDRLGHISPDSQRTYLEFSQALAGADRVDKLKESEKMRITRQARIEQELLSLKRNKKNRDFDV